MLSLVHLVITFSFAQVSGSKCTLETIAPSCPENEDRIWSHNKCFKRTLSMEYSDAWLRRQHCEREYQGTYPLLLTPSDQDELYSLITSLGFPDRPELNIYFDENSKWQWRECWRYNRSNQGAKTRYQNFDSQFSNKGDKDTCVVMANENGKWETEHCDHYRIKICELWWDPSTYIDFSPVRPDSNIFFVDDTFLFTCTAFTRRTRGTLTWSVYSEDGHLEKETSVQEEPQAVKHPRGLCLLQLRSTMSFNLPKKLPAKITVACFTDGIKEEHRKCLPSHRLNCSSFTIDGRSFNSFITNNIGPIEVVNDPSMYPIYNGETLNYTIKARLLHNKVTDNFMWLRNTLGVESKIQNGEFRISHTKDIINDITILTSTLLVKMEPSILGTAFLVFSYRPFEQFFSKNCWPKDKYCYSFKPIAEPPKASATINVSYTGYPKAAYYGHMVKFTCRINGPEGQNKKVAWAINLPDKEPKLLSNTNPSVTIFPDEISKRGDLTSTLHVSMRKSYDNFSVACFGYEPLMFGEDGICDTNSSYCDISDNIMGVKGPNGDLSEVVALVLLLIANLVLALLILLGCLYYNCGTRNDPVKEIDDLGDEGSLFDARDDAKMTAEMLAGDPMLITAAGEVVDHKVSIDTTSNAETSSTI